MPPALALSERAEMVEAVAAAAQALGRLEGRVAASPLKAAWRARARVHGVARMLALGGVSVTPAEYFRGLVGLVEPAAWPHYDWRTLSVACALFDEAQPATSAAEQLVTAPAAGGHLLSPTWLDELDAYRSAATEAEAAWPIRRGGSLVDLGLALHGALRQPTVSGWQSDPRLDHVYRLTGWQPEAPWRGWLLAPRLAQRIAAATGGPPLPCLVPLRRSMRFATLPPVETVRAFLAELEAQSAAGLATLERQEACAAAWRARLGTPTPRSRLAAAAAYLLVMPIVTRTGLARALGVTVAGAGDLLGRLGKAAIVRPHVMSPRVVFYVADEALGDFKLRARQGRHPAPPANATSDGTFDELADALADIDRLLGRSGAEDMLA